MKKIKASKTAHTSDSKVGRGDYYGTGVRNKVGRTIDVMGMKTLSKSKLKTPPKSLA